MIHNFTPQEGTGRKSMAIRELQNAVRKITPRTGANVTTRGTQIRAKRGSGGTGASQTVVSRWL
jgi:hypothetical protein|tara:strand:+ start:689 stop:880 length:192 start_codon:yes stop_codon:yes gene_type:complete